MSEWSLSNKKQIATTLILCFVLVMAIEVAALNLWRIDFSVPFNYWGDTLWFVVPIKGMIQNGWTYEIPQLSAPFGLSAAGFPSMTNLDWLIMKVISLFVSDAGAVLNIYWLFSIVLTAWTAYIALRLLNINNWLALGTALVYAFLPFALLRNVAHISLVYFTVPLLTLLAIYFARGCDHPRAGLVRFLGYGAAIAQGFNYIYFSFFAVLLFAFAGLLGFVQKRSWRSVRGAVTASGIVIMVASLNLVPSFLSWSEHGKPPDMGYKSASEAEVYGLKIRKMLAPNEANPFPLFSQWGQRDKSVNFPNENENVTARLGPMAAVGLLLLLMASVGLSRSQDSRESGIIKTLASLALFSLLFTTIGGFGAIFNQILPDFRGYNRFSVFIAFLALAGLALWWQGIMNTATKRPCKKILAAAFITLIVFSLYDQLLDAGHLNNRRAAEELSAKHERELVGFIESKVPAGTSVYQLPITGFPPDGGKERMLPYDHARAFLWSDNLSWSWPSFSQRHRNWLDQLNGLEGKELTEALALSKFRLIWVDRFGYPDNGDRMISSLLAVGAVDVAPGMSHRYAVLDLMQVTERLKGQLGAEELERRQVSLLNVPGLIWNKGFYSLEHNPEGRAFRWSRAEGGVEIHNWSAAPWSGVLSFSVASGKPGKFTVSSGSQSASVVLAGEPIHMELPLTLHPSSNVVVHFVGDMGKINTPLGETRDLHFYLMDMRLRAVTESKFKLGVNGES